MALGIVRNQWGGPFATYLDHIPVGWRPMTKSMVEDLFALGWDGELLQLKEKFGGLRFYIKKGSPEIFDRIEKAEVESFVTCQLCGASAKGRIKETGWIYTLCHKHASEGKFKDLETGEVLGSSTA